MQRSGGELRWEVLWRESDVAGKRARSGELRQFVAFLYASPPTRLAMINCGKP